ncbi:MAG: trimethylamine methyltransferase family protein [Pseudomonadota bacterium]
MVRGRRHSVEEPAQPIAPAAPNGGRYRPLTKGDVKTICDAAFAILEDTGMDECPPDVAERAIAAGAIRRKDGRITFPRSMVEDAIARAARRVNLPGFIESLGLTIGGGSVHVGTGGAAVQVLDAATMQYRDSTLRDLYRLMRIVGGADYVHYGIRPTVARDIEHPQDLDINTAFACLKACAKPIGISFDNPAHVEPVINLFDLALGGAGRFRHRPFCFAVIVHAVSPLRFAPEGIETMKRAMAVGMPLQICTAAQAGATSPVTLAGALAQGLAEALAGLMIVDCLNPGYPCIFALMPFISDLRTGAMTGGSGESAVANAAAAQLLLDLGLPSTVSAGMTDAKTTDAQAGYEKGYSMALAAQAGADMINLSVGMLGSIMAASPEALVIDDEMCGAILRTVRGIEFSDATIDLDLIEKVATGPGHYLGEAQTLAMMKREYVYPRLGDRQSISDWKDAGSLTIWDRARQRVAALTADPPSHLDRSREAAIRDRFNIHLDIE